MFSCTSVHGNNRKEPWPLGRILYLRVVSMVAHPLCNPSIVETVSWREHLSSFLGNHVIAKDILRHPKRRAPKPKTTGMSIMNDFRLAEIVDLFSVCVCVLNSYSFDVITSTTTTRSIQQITADEMKRIEAESKHKKLATNIYKCV